MGEIRRPTQAITNVNNTENTKQEQIYGFINPAVQPLVSIKMVKGQSWQSNPGPMVYRPIPLRDWSVPVYETPQFTSLIDRESGTGEPRFGSWLCSFCAVFRFGLDFKKSVNLMLSTPFFNGPNKDNPYKIIYDFLKGRRGAIPSNRPSWYALTEVDPAKKKFFAVFNAPKTTLAVPALIYRDNTVDPVVDYSPDRVPYGINKEDKLPIIFIKGISAFSSFKTTLFMEVDGRLVYGDPIAPSGGRLFYTQCGGYDVISKTERGIREGYVLSLSKDYYRQDGSRFAVDTSLSDSLKRDLIENKSFPWWTGPDYDGIFREQPPEEILFLMAKAFPEGEEVYRHVLEPAHPEWFSDRVNDAFDEIPKSQRTNVDFKMLIDNVQNEQEQYRQRNELAREEAHNSQGMFVPQQHMPNREYNSVQDYMNDRNVYTQYPNQQAYVSQQPGHMHNVQQQMYPQAQVPNVQQQQVHPQATVPNVQQQMYPQAQVPNVQQQQVHPQAQVPNVQQQSNLHTKTATPYQQFPQHTPQNPYGTVVAPLGGYPTTDNNVDNVNMSDEDDDTVEETPWGVDN